MKEMIFMDGDCIFLKDGSCSVYENRPTACRIFPLTSNGNEGMIDQSCPHADKFETDPLFLSEANSGLKRIIQDIEETIDRARKAEIKN